MKTQVYNKQVFKIHIATRPIPIKCKNSKTYGATPLPSSSNPPNPPNPANNHPFSNKPLATSLPTADNSSHFPAPSSKTILILFPNSTKSSRKILLRKRIPNLTSPSNPN